MDRVKEELILGMYQGQQIKMQQQADGQIRLLLGTTDIPASKFKCFRLADIGTVGGVAPICGLELTDVWRLASLVDHAQEEHVNADLLASSSHFSDQQKQACRDLFSALSDNVWREIKDIVNHYDPEKARKTLHTAAATRRASIMVRIESHERALKDLRTELEELGRQEAANG